MTITSKERSPGVSTQQDLETLYMSLKLGSRHLYDMMEAADPRLATDLCAAKSLLLQAAEKLARHIDSNNISVLRQRAP